MARDERTRIRGALSWLSLELLLQVPPALPTAPDTHAEPTAAVASRSHVVPSGHASSQLAPAAEMLSMSPPQANGPTVVGAAAGDVVGAAAGDAGAAQPASTDAAGLAQHL
jgi:hypothetical protein